MRGQTVWITGAAGFIGRALARALAGVGASVVGLGHGALTAPDLAASGLSHWISGDVHADHLATLARLGGPPAVVYHLAGGASVGAAEADPEADLRRTVTSTAVLLDWLARAAPATRVVAVSSAAVYGAGHAGPIPETAPVNPVSVYGRHKAMMEALCRDHAGRGLPVVTGRLFSVYGAGLRKQLLWDLSSRLAADPTVIELAGTGDELRDWTAIGDIVSALPRLAELAAADCPILNVGTGRGVSVRDVAAAAIAAWGSSARLSFSGVSRPGDPFSLIADTTAASARAIICPSAVEAGVGAYINWSRRVAELAA